MVTRPAKGDITIRELLCHSSGISYDSYGQDVEVIRYGSPVTTAEAVSRISKLPLKHDPGMGFTYGYSLDVAGRLAEVISGMRLALSSKREYWILEMTDTISIFQESLQTTGSRLYEKIRTPLYYWPIHSICTIRSAESGYFGGGAGLSSTIEIIHTCAR
jgi:CubicO group peptidase (beta-lactamase class C family)